MASANAPPPETWASANDPPQGWQRTCAAPAGAGFACDAVSGGGAFALATGYPLRRLRRRSGHCLRVESQPNKTTLSPKVNAIAAIVRSLARFVRVAVGTRNRGAGRFDMGEAAQIAVVEGIPAHRLHPLQAGDVTAAEASGVDEQG